MKNADINAQLAKVHNNNFEDKEPLQSDVVIEGKNLSKDSYPLEEEEKIVTNDDEDDGTYLRLSGAEEECLFSSKALDNKPTINVS